MTLGRATASAAPFNIVFCQRRLADRASCRCANLGLAVQAENVPLRETKVEEGSRNTEEGSKESEDTEDSQQQHGFKAWAKSKLKVHHMK